MSESFELPDEKERLKLNLEDDVRSFLLRHLPWNRMHPGQRAHLQQMGVDPKHLRRPSYIAIKQTDEAAPPEVVRTKCNIGAEGVMAHTDEDCVHLAFKCGNPQHPYHYTTLGVETVASLAMACEVAWPGSISRMLAAHILKKRGLEIQEILNPGDDEIDLDEEEDDDEIEGAENVADEDLEDDDDDDEFFI